MSRAGRLLLAEGLVSQEQLEDAARQQSLKGGTIGLHLVRAGVVREGTLTSLLCSQLKLDEVADDDLQFIEPDVASLLPAEVAVISRVVPLEMVDDKWLAVAMSDPTDDRTVAEVARLTGLRLVIKVAQESELSLTLERLYGTSRPSELPEWNDTRETRPSGTLANDDDVYAFEEPESTSSRRFRAPVVLEGKYEKITPDDLPPDADAGYIPLTQVKRRPPGAKPTENVIQVKNVAIVHEGETHDELSTGESADSPPPPFEELAQRLRTLTEPEPKRHGTKPSPSAKNSSDRYRPPTPSNIPPKEAPVQSKNPAEVTGGDTWDIEETETESQLEIIENPVVTETAKPARRPGRRDTLMDLPKIDTGHWSGSSAKSLEDFIEDVNQAATRDEVIQASLSFIASYCRRAAFFVLKRGVVEGFDALGPNLSLDQVRSIWIPLSSRSTICKSITSKSIRIGPIGDTRVDAIFCAALGGRKGDSIIIPVTIANRAVSVLYGDDLRGNPPALEDIQTVADTLSDVLSKIVVQEKKTRST